MSGRKKTNAGERTILSNIENRCSSLIMLFWHSMRIVEQLTPIYNTTGNKNYRNIALNVAKQLTEKKTMSTQY